MIEVRPHLAHSAEMNLPVSMLQRAFSPYPAFSHPVLCKPMDVPPSGLAGGCFLSHHAASVVLRISVLRCFLSFFLWWRLALSRREEGGGSLRVATPSKSPRRAPAKLSPLAQLARTDARTQQNPSLIL